MARPLSAPDILPIRVQRAGEHLLLRLIDIAEFDRHQAAPPSRSASERQTSTTSAQSWYRSSRPL